jgi:hypothetical protein
MSRLSMHPLSPPEASRAAHIARRLALGIADIPVVRGPSGLVGLVDPVTGDILGAGRTLTDAIDDAWATVRAWDAA